MRFDGLNDDVDLSHYTLARLHDDTEFVLHRGVALADSASVPRAILVLTLTAEPPGAEQIRGLEHEFELRHELDPSWATRPLALARYEGRAALIFEDVPAVPLRSLLDRPRELGRLLRFAVGMAGALRKLHERGIIHKDVKPEHFLVDARTGRAWLTGFRVASRLPRERPAPLPLEIISGSLAYMAPEQTGRMNRSIDARSDLYALGVTLYEMVTGTLPFTALNAIELVHCHIARRPVPPDERVPDVPAVVSAIIMKLLAKTAEERYQTAAGLERDLRRCAAQFDAEGHVDDFAAGEQDMSDRLLIPEKLYGREREVESLAAAFERVLEGGTPELVLVSGYSGIGKSAVVHDLQKLLVAPRGLFAVGKFDQFKRDIPYATVAQALQEIVRPLLGTSDDELDRWRRALREALGPNARLMVDLVPELNLILGAQPAVPELPSLDAQSRFQLVFRRFLSVFARPEHPLALFLDDLQWVDVATLHLLEDVLTHPDVGYVLVIGAYRDNEVDALHPLVHTVDRVRRAGAPVLDIRLAPLTPKHLGQAIAESLHCSRGRAAPLAALVHRKTAGNPFFAVQFLAVLAEEGLLQFDHGAAVWAWDLVRINAKGYTDNVVELMHDKLCRLPMATQEALQQLACLGNGGKIALLAMVRDASKAELERDLQEALQAGLILASDDEYWFAHDRIQEAAHAQLPEARRVETHLRIGRLLASRTAPEDRGEAIFEIVNQLNRGVALVTSTIEREQLAEFNLIAARRAKASTAYSAALNYLVAASACLSDDAWERRPDLVFPLELQRAECEFLTGERVAADARLTLLAARAENPVDSATIACLKMDLYTTLDQSDRAIEVCLSYLRRSGLDCPAHPTEAQAQREYERTGSLLGDRKIESLVDLPRMEDPESVAIVEVLAKALAPARFTDVNLFCLLVWRMVNLSLEHGNADASCYAYGRVASIAGPRFGNYEAGFKFGRLGYDLVERHGLKRFQARTYLDFGVFVMARAEHPRIGRAFIRRAFDAANAIGDLPCAAFSLHNLISNLLAAGDPLVDVQREAERGLEFARKARFGLVIDTISTQLAFIRSLQGSTPVFGRLDGAQIEEAEFERHLSSNEHLAFAACWYWARKLQARVLAGNFEEALEASLNAQRLQWTSPASFERVETHFFGALALAALCDAAHPVQHREHVNALTAHHEQLVQLALTGSRTFGHRAALVGAEIARIEGRNVDAERLYEESIRSARENGFVQNEGLALELAGQYYLGCGLDTAGTVLLRDARNRYERWGAHGKVAQLDRRHPFLHQAPPVSGAMIGVQTGQLDVETVVKASQALSSEMVLPRLIEKLVRIAVENAGAERGLLILLRDGEPQIEAEVVAGTARVEVAVRQAAVTATDLPRSMLLYILRTQESVLLDDASIDTAYSKDDYVRQNRSRSVFCLPIVKQGKLAGALYLENNLTPGAFTPDRVSVLQLLASQAAISLENAALYADLQLQAELLQRLPVSAWTLEPDGTPDFVNQVWLEYSGQTLDFIRSHPEAWMTAVHADDREAASKVFRGGVRLGQGFTMEARSRRARDGAYRWHINQAVVLREADGKVLKFIGTTTDIDDQKRAEEALRQSQSDLARINRVTTMGELAASLAHELIQPITGVMTNARVGLRMLGSDEPDKEAVRAVVTRIERDAQRAADIIERIRSQFRKNAPRQEPLDLSEAIREIIGLLHDEVMRNRITVRSELAVDLPRIVGDRVQLQQVAMNLIINSIEAMKDVVGAREVVVRSTQIGDGQVLVSVVDTGIGLPPKSAERIFDPFFTTKPNSTGMGLRISQSIIESHGGRLWATPNDGLGATFTFSIPCERSR